ncbi:MULTISPECIES: hypothetical protein [Aerococcus]|uniref:hypothetical protein n=1 Tax=Aerococcus TaxID=1375 RepID=UPI0018E17F17|nr:MULTISPECIES: hypothetical protein [Aerococcus]MCY3036303.1 hypothetical protein [Aerococcus sp. Group 2]MCY3039663.1 hypothetical protein [Aerococcus sp. Group 2]MCY3041870.1 hypothetical protein [Aerococcus sp. Group 2]MCY3043119.1 hypothetical protein [Aerococcus sp. Group 2]MDK6520317.1 hypothetical protein [Aerococcus urinae]
MKLDLKTLPTYIEKDILALLHEQEVGGPFVADIGCELYGSINSAMWDKEISKEVADYLFSKYLGL